MDDREIELTQAEWSVMECLWGDAPLTGRELTERMAAKCGWSRSTTLTLLGRLEAKGAVSGDGGTGRKVYRPLLRREDIAQRETESFLGRVYRGSLSLMVSAFTKKQSLSQREIDELYDILKGLEAKSDDD